MADAKQLLAVYKHGSQERLPYGFDWSRVMAAEGDAIASSTWVAESGSPTIGNGSNGGAAASVDGDTTSVWIVDGTPGASYVLTNVITTVGNLRFERSLRIDVVDK